MGSKVTTRALAVRKELEERGPTPETRAKLRQDQILVLHGTGKIDERQFTAAQEIREMMDAISALHFRGMGGESIGAGRRAFHPLDGFTVKQKRIFDRNYRPWRYWADTHFLPGSRKTLTEVTARVVLDSIAPPDAILPHLIASLERYADISEGD